jgi:hypothetical protein
MLRLRLFLVELKGALRELDFEVVVFAQNF